MRKDVAFLQSMHLMDYSMLIAIERAQEHDSELQLEAESLLTLAESHNSGYSKRSRRFRARAEKHIFEHDGKILHISIIDYLQKWNCNKKGERLYKTLVLRKDPDRLSAIEPETYARRFRHFMESQVFA